MSISLKLLPLPVIAALSACATIPDGPSVAVLPGANKSFEQFREDNVVCRHYAQETVGQTAGQAAADSAVKSAAVGTALGAAAGALIGAATGNAGTGAAIGAGGGLLAGGAFGSDAYGRSAYVVQDRYDIAYMQCMYTKGNQVPMPTAYRLTSPGYQPPPPPPPQGAYSPPPPPPGPPPPPPS